MKLVVVEIAAFADGVKYHRLRIGLRVGLPFEAGLGGIAGAGEVDPRARDQILKGVAGGSISSGDAHMRFVEVVEDEGKLRSVERRDAAVDGVLIGEEIVVDWRLAGQALGD